MFAISNDELRKGDWAEPGDLVHCPHCQGTHPLEAGADPDGQPALVVLFYSCGPNSYLGAVGQRLLPGVDLALTQPT